MSDHDHVFGRCDCVQLKAAKSKITLFPGWIALRKATGGTSNSLGGVQGTAVMFRWPKTTAHLLYLDLYT